MSTGAVAFSQESESAQVAHENHGTQTPGEIANAQTEKMTELLALSEAQIEQVRVLNLKVATKIDVIRNDETMSAERKKEFIKGNRDDHKTMMKSILTDEQFATYEAHLAAKKSMRKGMNPKVTQSPAEVPATGPATE